MKIYNYLLLIGLFAFYLVSPLNNYDIFMSSVLFVAEFLVPSFVLFEIGKKKTAFLLISTILSAFFLAWGSFFLFKPLQPPIYSAGVPEISNLTWRLTTYAIHSRNMGMYPEVWYDVRRYNWCFIFLFHSFILMDSLVHAEFNLGSNFFGSNFKRCREKGESTNNFNNFQKDNLILIMSTFGLMVIGLAFIIRSAHGILAIIYSISCSFLLFRAIVKMQFTRNLFDSLKKSLKDHDVTLPITLGLIAGFTVGLTWNWFIWYSVVIVFLILFAFIIFFYARKSSISFRRFILAIFWSLAVSIQAVELPKLPKSSNMSKYNIKKSPYYNK